MTETRPSYLYAAVQAVENDEEQALARADLALLIKQRMPGKN